MATALFKGRNWFNASDNKKSFPLSKEPKVQTELNNVCKYIPPVDLAFPPFACKPFFNQKEENLTGLRTKGLIFNKIIPPFNNFRRELESFLWKVLLRECRIKNEGYDWFIRCCKCK